MSSREKTVFHFRSCVFGDAGSGKSSLLRVLSIDAPPDSFSDQHTHSAQISPTPHTDTLDASPNDLGFPTTISFLSHGCLCTLQLTPFAHAISSQVASLLGDTILAPYAHGSSVSVVLFDVRSRTSFQWATTLCGKLLQDDMVVVLVGTKCDAQPEDCKSIAQKQVSSHATTTTTTTDTDKTTSALVSTSLPLVRPPVRAVAAAEVAQWVSTYRGRILYREVSAHTGLHISQLRTLLCELSLAMGLAQRRLLEREGWARVMQRGKVWWGNKRGTAVVLPVGSRGKALLRNYTVPLLAVGLWEGEARESAWDRVCANAMAQSVAQPVAQSVDTVVLEEGPTRDEEHGRRSVLHTASNAPCIARVSNTPRTGVRAGGTGNTPRLLAASGTPRMLAAGEGSRRSVVGRSVSYLSLADNGSAENTSASTGTSAAMSAPAHPALTARRSLIAPRASTANNTDATSSANAAMASGSTGSSSGGRDASALARARSRPLQTHAHALITTTTLPAPSLHTHAPSYIAQDATGTRLDAVGGEYSLSTAQSLVASNQGSAPSEQHQVVSVPTHVFGKHPLAPPQTSSPTQAHAQAPVLAQLSHASPIDQLPRSASSPSLSPVLPAVDTSTAHRSDLPSPASLPQSPASSPSPSPSPPSMYPYRAAPVASFLSPLLSPLSSLPAPLSLLLLLFLSPLLLLLVLFGLPGLAARQLWPFTHTHPSVAFTASVATHGTAPVPAHNNATSSNDDNIAENDDNGDKYADDRDASLLNAAITMPRAFSRILWWKYSSITIMCIAYAIFLPIIITAIASQRSEDSLSGDISTSGYSAPEWLKILLGIWACVWMFFLLIAALCEAMRAKREDVGPLQTIADHFASKKAGTRGLSVQKQDVNPENYDYSERGSKFRNSSGRLTSLPASGKNIPNISLFPSQTRSQSRLSGLSYNSYSSPHHGNFPESSIFLTLSSVPRSTLSRSNLHGRAAAQRSTHGDAGVELVSLGRDQDTTHTPPDTVAHGLSTGTGPGMGMGSPRVSAHVPPHTLLAEQQETLYRTLYGDSNTAKTLYNKAHTRKALPVGNVATSGTSRNSGVGFSVLQRVDGAMRGSVSGMPGRGNSAAQEAMSGGTNGNSGVPNCTSAASMNAGICVDAGVGSAVDYDSDDTGATGGSRGVRATSLSNLFTSPLPPPPPPPSSLPSQTAAADHMTSTPASTSKPAFDPASVEENQEKQTSRDKAHGEAKSDTEEASAEAHRDSNAVENGHEAQNKGKEQQVTNDIAPGDELAIPTPEIQPSGKSGEEDLSETPFFLPSGYFLPLFPNSPIPEDMLSPSLPQYFDEHEQVDSSEISKIPENVHISDPSLIPYLVPEAQLLNTADVALSHVIRDSQAAFMHYKATSTDANNSNNTVDRDADNLDELAAHLGLTKSSRAQQGYGSVYPDDGSMPKTQLSLGPGMAVSTGVGLGAGVCAPLSDMGPSLIQIATDAVIRATTLKYQPQPQRQPHQQQQSILAASAQMSSTLSSTASALPMPAPVPLMPVAGPVAVGLWHILPWLKPAAAAALVPQGLMALLPLFEDAAWGEGAGQGDAMGEVGGDGRGAEVGDQAAGRENMDIVREVSKRKEHQFHEYSTTKHTTAPSPPLSASPASPSASPSLTLLASFAYRFFFLLTLAHSLALPLLSLASPPHWLRVFAEAMFLLQYRRLAFTLAVTVVALVIVVFTIQCMADLYLLACLRRREVARIALAPAASLNSTPQPQPAPSANTNTTPSIPIPISPSHYTATAVTVDHYPASAYTASSSPCLSSSLLGLTFASALTSPLSRPALSLPFPRHLLRILTTALAPFTLFHLCLGLCYPNLDLIVLTTTSSAPAPPSPATAPFATIAVAALCLSLYLCASIVLTPSLSLHAATLKAHTHVYVAALALRRLLLHVWRGSVDEQVCRYMCGHGTHFSHALPHHRSHSPVLHRLEPLAAAPSPPASLPLASLHAVPSALPTPSPSISNEREHPHATLHGSTPYVNAHNAAPASLPAAAAPRSPVPLSPPSSPMSSLAPLPPSALRPHLLRLTLASVALLSSTLASLRLNTTLEHTGTVIAACLRSLAITLFLFFLISHRHAPIVLLVPAMVALLLLFIRGWLLTRTAEKVKLAVNHFMVRLNREAAFTHAKQQATATYGNHGPRHAHDAPHFPPPSPHSPRSPAAAAAAAPTPFTAAMAATSILPTLFLGPRASVRLLELWGWLAVSISAACTLGFHRGSDTAFTITWVLVLVILAAIALISRQIAAAAAAEEGEHGEGVRRASVAVGSAYAFDWTAGDEVRAAEQEEARAFEAMLEAADALSKARDVGREVLERAAERASREAGGWDVEDMHEMLRRLQPSTCHQDKHAYQYTHMHTHPHGPDDLQPTTAVLSSGVDSGAGAMVDAVRMIRWVAKESLHSNLHATQRPQQREGRVDKALSTHFVDPVTTTKMTTPSPATTPSLSASMGAVASALAAHTTTNTTNTTSTQILAANMDIASGTVAQTSSNSNTAPTSSTNGNAATRTPAAFLLPLDKANQLKSITGSHSTSATTTARSSSPLHAPRRTPRTPPAAAAHINEVAVDMVQLLLATATGKPEQWACIASAGMHACDGEASMGTGIGLDSSTCVGAVAGGTGVAVSAEVFDGAAGPLCGDLARALLVLDLAKVAEAAATGFATHTSTGINSHSHARSNARLTTASASTTTDAGTDTDTHSDVSESACGNAMDGGVGAGAGASGMGVNNNTAARCCCEWCTVALPLLNKDGLM